MIEGKGARWGHLMKSAALAVLMVLGLGLVGCSSEPAEVTIEDILKLGRDRGAGDVLIDRISDGEVSRAEYEATIADYRACVAGLGVGMGETLYNPIDGWRFTIDLDFRGDSSKEITEAVDSCYEVHYGVMQLAYDLLNAPVMAPDLVIAVRECLEKQGLSTTGTETNLPDFLGAEGVESTRGAAARTCSFDEGHLLYPEHQLSIVL